MTMYSFFTAFDPLMILLCTSGAALGIIWAALPGLSTTMAMALLVGLTYSMSAETAIIFILGTYTGSVFGGAISAILINIPGTPDAVPTQMAGFPLAKKGQGGLALGMSITASMAGNWAGILLLVVCVPYILDIALKFASWEVALLALWGISISGTLTAGERPVKGWISGWLGVLLAMVGREEIYGVERFIFGSQELLLGIPYIPVLIGLFGLAEIFQVLGEPQPYVIPQKIGRMFPPFRMFIKYWKSIIRSSIVGLITGIIPGAGANVATFVSYGIGERTSGRKFSDGDMEGVVCSEVANNANIGGALLPSLVLGIPGSAPTAAFLAALNLHDQQLSARHIVLHVRHPDRGQYRHVSLRLCPDKTQRQTFLPSPGNTPAHHCHFLCCGILHRKNGHVRHLPHVRFRPCARPKFPSAPWFWA